MRALPWVLGFLGSALVLGGVVVFAAANGAWGGPPGDFGWTTYTGSYAPLHPGEPRAYESVVSFPPDGSVLWTSWISPARGWWSSACSCSRSWAAGCSGAGPVVRRTNPRFSACRAAACRAWSPAVPSGHDSKRDRAELWRDLRR